METEYQRYLKSERWQKIKSIVWARAEGCCEDCHSCERLETHHWHYRNIFREPVQYDENGYPFVIDCVLLCKSCHEARHPKWLRHLPIDSKLK